jgi:DNA-binding transcriptional regulator YiaG
MTRYPHFAFPNLFLLNGYKEIESHHGVLLEYEDEDGLEQSIRCLVIRKTARLRGRDLRFLRRGLKLSQMELGTQVDRDSQTIARWEKRNDEIPSTVDLAIRVRFAAQFEPHLSTKQILSYVDRQGSKLPANIYLRLTDRGWQFEHEPKVKFASSAVSGDAHAQFAASARALYRLYEQFERANTGLLTIEPQTMKRFGSIELQLPKTLEALRKGRVLIVGTEVPRSVVQTTANEATQAPTQKLKVEIKGSAHEYANATIH